MRGGGTLEAQDTFLGTVFPVRFKQKLEQTVTSHENLWNSCRKHDFNFPKLSCLREGSIIFENSVLNPFARREMERKTLQTMQLNISQGKCKKLLFRMLYQGTQRNVVQQVTNNTVRRPSCFPSFYLLNFCLWDLAVRRYACTSQTDYIIKVLQ